VNSTKAVFRAGDVLYGKLRPYLNKVAIPQFAGICSTDILVFAQRPHIDSRFLMHFLSRREVVEFASHHSTGVQLPRIGFGTLGSVEVPLPPLAEQRRIVAAIERVSCRVNAARVRLGRVPSTLKRFRQAVLAAACSGRLTADWRQQRSPKESAEKMRSRLLERRRARLAVSGIRRCEPVAADADYLENIPEGWAVFSMEELTTIVTSGSRDWSKYYGRGTGTFLMAQNVRPGMLDLSFRQPVDPPEADRDRKRSQVEVGDLLVTIVGANTGDVCHVDRALPQHYVCQSVALMRTIEAAFGPYLNLYLNSPRHGRAQYDRYIYGEGRPHLSFDHLKMTAICLPPLAEQREIVRRVNAMFALADRIESRLSAARQRVDTMTQAVLAKAFRGELVPTEAELALREGRDYEPASALLDRIRAERAAATPAARRKQVKTK
jgi:type I restriction enzyme S subunit